MIERSILLRNGLESSNETDYRSPEMSHQPNNIFAGTDGEMKGRLLHLLEVRMLKQKMPPIPEILDSVRKLVVAHAAHDEPGFAKNAESIVRELTMTVGSIAQSERVIVAPGVPIARENQPSPFTRTGPGFDDSIKPDFVERGGNLINDQQRGILHNAGTNVVMASGQLTPPLQHSHGTSFAGPRVANHIVGIIRDLRAIVPEPSAPLVRAFTALSANTPSNSPFSNLDDSLCAAGYGLPDAARATDCAGHSVVLFHDGNLEADRVALFRIPVPIEIRNSGRALKQIAVAIATAPAVQTWGVAEYLAAQMKFRLFRGDKSIEDIVAMMQREDGDENLASETQVQDLPGKLKVRRRSVGTLQRDVFEWNDHEEAFSADDYILGVSLSAASWCKSNPPNVPIGIAIRIEDTSGVCQQLYARVRARVQEQARVQA